MSQPERTPLTGGHPPSALGSGSAPGQIAPWRVSDAGCATRPGQAAGTGPPSLAGPGGAAGPPAAGLQDQHRASVLANRLSLTHDWGQPCSSCLLCVRPGPAARAALAAVQDKVAGPEHSLLRVPPAALHFSVAWLLPVHMEFSRAKDDLWAEHGPGWLAGITDVLRSVPPFTLRLCQLVATDTAVIAVAAAPNPVTAIRARLGRRLSRPHKLPVSRGDLVHTTLFRYGGALREPPSFLVRVAAAGIDAEIPVHEIVLVREHLFPSLGFKAVHRFALAPG